jgi:NTP pyrophosphatase (non-canonical NTP hydrolase)
MNTSLRWVTQVRKIKQIINDLLDMQEQKGIQTYGHSLEDCPDDKFDWQQMTIEELIDALQYQVKFNMYLKRQFSLSDDDLTNDVLFSVAIERIDQNKQWGLQRHDYGKWLGILGEEVGEVAQAINRIHFPKDAKSSDASNLYTELIQVAAVAVAIAEQVKEEGEKK